MYQYKRLLVGLDFSDRDPYVIRYASLISQMAKSEKVYFAHVSKSLDVTDEFRQEHNNIFVSIDEYAKEQMQKLIKENFDESQNIDVKCEVAEGSRYIELLKWSSRKEIDLIIVGKKLAGQGASLPERLCRKSHCSVLIVPEGAKASIHNILVSTDYSEHSVEAVEVACKYAKAANVTHIFCLNVYSLPSGYYKTGMNYEEFGKIMKAQSEKKYHEFIEKIDLKGIKTTPIFKQYEKPAVAINDTVDERKIDLVLVGSRGRSNPAAMVLGSVTEKLIHNIKVPLIAVKEKGDNMGLLQAFLEKM